jgi:hypothetical protein
MKKFLKVLIVAPLALPLFSCVFYYWFYWNLKLQYSIASMVECM